MRLISSLIRPLLRGRLHLADHVGVAVEGDHADLVAVAEQLDGAAGGRLGHLDLVAAHRARFVDHQHHAEARLLLLLLEVAADRQDLFEHRLVVAAEAERLLAAEHDEAAAEVLHVGAGDFHLPLRERGGRHVREDEQLVVLQVGQVVGHAGRRAQIDLDVLLLQGERQLADQLGIALDDQHARLAGGEDQAAFGVVVEQRVACQALDAGRVVGQPLARHRLLEAEAVFALLDRPRSRCTTSCGAAIDGDRRLRRRGCESMTTST